jgi:hypothetical protein
VKAQGHEDRPTRGDPFGLTSRPPVIGRIVTATITLVCVLIVYDGWADLKLLDVVLVVVAPIVAIFTSHIFSTSLVQQVELGRRPSIREWLDNARFESRFLLLAVPPVGVLLVLRGVSVPLVDAVQVVIWLEALSLGFWAGLAGRYAGLRGRSLALTVLGGLVVSLIVLLLQVVLQPGKPVKDSAAPAAELFAAAAPAAPWTSPVSADVRRRGGPIASLRGQSSNEDPTREDRPERQEAPPRPDGSSEGDRGALGRGARRARGGAA